MVVLQGYLGIFELADSLEIHNLAEDPARVSVGEHLAGFHQIILYLGLEVVREAHSLRKIFGHRGSTEGSQFILQMECWIRHRWVKFAEDLSE